MQMGSTGEARRIEVRRLPIMLNKKELSACGQVAGLSPLRGQLQFFEQCFEITQRSTGAPSLKVQLLELEELFQDRGDVLQAGRTD